MASTTPTSAPPSSDRQRSSSRTRHPTTPLRAASRTSLRASTTTPAAHNSSQSTSSPLDALEPAFAEFSDSMADLEANMMHLQILQESLNRFNDNFGAFLYGMNMNAFTVDFTEAPGAESFKRAKEAAERSGQEAGRQFGFRGGGGPHDMPGGGHVVTGGGLGRDVDATFLYVLFSLGCLCFCLLISSSELRILLLSRTHPHRALPLPPELKWLLRHHPQPCVRQQGKLLKRLEP